jgi:hypothetical protein
MAGQGSARKRELGPLQRPLEELCCVNPACSASGRRGEGNLVVRTGKGAGRWRILRCRTCGSEFSERKGTALPGSNHTAVDVDSRLVVSLVVGTRDGETLKEVVGDFADRTGGAPPP